MRALVIDPPAGDADGDRPRVTLADVPFDAPDGECRIRVTLAGICGTDLELVRGYAGYRGVPGHEFVGVVEDAPDGDRHWVGRRVVGEINAACGDCEWCRAGTRTHCPRRTVLGIVGRAGAFATHVALPAANLHAVPASLADEAAVFTEPVAAACEILAQIDVTPAARVAVVGDGRLGLLVGQVLRPTGATVTLVGRHPDKLAVGARLGLTTATPDAPPAPRSCDIVVDATGRAEGLTRALALVRPRGTVVMKSTFHGETPVTLWPAVVDEVTLVGSRCGPFERAIPLLADGRVATAPLVAGTFPLEAHDEALALARRALKVLLRPE